VGPLAPRSLGRGVVVEYGKPAPDAWRESSRISIDASALSDAAAAVDQLHSAWVTRQPVVVEFAVDVREIRDPRPITSEPVWNVPWDTDPLVDRRWAVGRSGSFFSEHHHAMLFGNVIGALQKNRLASPGRAERIADDLWEQLSAGERRSSRAKAVVLPAVRSASVEWLLTLAGSQNGTDRLSAAYRAARERVHPAPAIVATAGVGFLPRRPEISEDICLSCPVAVRCAQVDRSPEGRGV
jgi:hypothetical protein